MATAPDELQPQPGEEEQNVDPNPAPDDAAPQDNRPDDQPPSVEDIARQTGWVPKEEYRGDPEKWKPAHQFILDGSEIQRTTARELREMRQTVDTISRTTGTIVQQKLAEQRAELERLHEQAVDEGDAKGAREISRQIDALSSQAPPQPVSGVEEWKRNNAWFQKDPLATDLAFEVCERLAKQGFSHQEQLEAAERRVRKEYPELFNDQPKPQQRPPAVAQPGSRVNTPSNRAKGFHDLPAAAQKIAIDMEERGLCKRDQYAANFFKMQANQAQR